MARMGFAVTGADASERNIGTAATHAAATGVKIDYRATTAEALKAEGLTFDVVLNMEVVEHVADLGSYLKGLCGTDQAGRADARRHLEQDAESARPGEDRRRICAWLAAARTHDWNRLSNRKSFARCLRYLDLIS